MSRSSPIQSWYFMIYLENSVFRIFLSDTGGAVISATPTTGGWVSPGQWWTTCRNLTLTNYTATPFLIRDTFKIIIIRLLHWQVTTAGIKHYRCMTVVRMNHLFNEKLHWWWWWRCDRSQWVTSVCQCLPSTVGMQWVVIWYSRVSGERVKHAESSRSEVTRVLV